MKRLISLLLCALLIVPALAEDAPDFEPIPHRLREQVPVEAGAPRQRHDEALQRRHGHRRRLLPLP